LTAIFLLVLVKYDKIGAIKLAHDVGEQNYAERRPVVLDTTMQSDPLRGDEEIVLGRWVRQERRFYPTFVSPNAVRAIAKRMDGLGERAPALSLVFGRVFGANTANAQRLATAWSQASTGSGIICLAADPRIYRDWNNGPTGFLINGGADIDLRWKDPNGTIVYGDIQVNSVSMATNPKAAFSKTGTGDSNLYVGEINVVGWTHPDPNSSTWLDMYGEPDLPFSVDPCAPRVEDPLKALNDDPPDINAMAPGSDANGTTYYDPNNKTFTTIKISGGQLILNPGYYPGGIDMTGGDIVLRPGVYAFGGGTVKNNPPRLVVNGGSVHGTEGVMLHITGDPSGIKTGMNTEYGRVYVGGNGHVELTSRGDTSPDDEIGTEGEDGVVIWQDINNHNQATIIGTPNSWLKGTIYFPDNPAQVGGGSDELGSQIIAGALQVNGNVNLSIAYDGRNMIVARKSILVE
jgi:hypothetical protein